MAQSHCPELFRGVLTLERLIRYPQEFPAELIVAELVRRNRRVRFQQLD